MSMTTPSTTVIVPAYNAEQTITNTISSILSQSVKANEIIVVDDGSTDGTVDIVRSISDNAISSGIRVISQHNAGPGSARNTGLRAASKELVMFVDADDELERDAIQSVVECSESVYADVYAFNIQIVDKRSHSKTNIRTLNKFPAGQSGAKQFGIHALCEGWLSNYSIAFAYRRDWLNENSLEFPENYSVLEDAVFITRVFSKSPSIYCLDCNPLYNYIMNKKSLVHTYSLKKAIDVIGAVEEIELCAPHIRPEYLIDKLIFAASIIDYNESGYKDVIQTIRARIVEYSHRSESLDLSPRSKIKLLLIESGAYPLLRKVRQHVGR